jgi:CBS domain-containing protein
MNVMSETLASHMRREPPRIDPDDPLEQAESVLRSSHSRHWPVVHNRELVGFISLRDLLTARLPQTDWATPTGELRTSHVMTHAPIVAHPDDDLLSGTLLMERYRLSCLPVVQDEGDLIGVVTLGHLVEVAIELLREEERRSGIAPRVQDLMTSAPLATAWALDDVQYADSLMKEYSVRHLPVVSEGRLLGILSDADVLRALSSSEDPGEILVQEIMTATPRTTAPDTLARTAGQLMLHHHIGALPVVRDAQILGARETNLIGILSKADFLRYLRTAESHV